MEKVFTPSFVLEIGGIIVGFCLLVYANKFHISFLRVQFKDAKDEIGKRITDIHGQIGEIHEAHEELRANQIKNCNNIKHMTDKLEKLEDRCYRQHVKAGE